MTIKEELLNGEKQMGIWGMGYIGYSSMAYFASKGVKCLGVDVDSSKVDQINNGKLPIHNIEYWLGFDTKPLVKPHSGILIEVVEKLAAFRELKLDTPPLMIIESTLTPNTTERTIMPAFEKKEMMVGRDILVGVAPRRDWFISSEKSLRNLPRVVGGTTPETTALMQEILGIVCDTILPAKCVNRIEPDIMSCPFVSLSGVSETNYHSDVRHFRAHF